MYVWKKGRNVATKSLGHESPTRIDRYCEIFRAVSVCVCVFSLAPHVLFLCLFGDEEEEHSHHHMPSSSAQSGIDKVDAFLLRPVRPELCSPSCIQRTLACL